MRRLFFYTVFFLCVFFCARLFPQETGEFNAQKLSGAQLSDALSLKLAEAGFEQQFLYVTGEEDGFPYTITVLLPVDAPPAPNEANAFTMKKLVIASAQDSALLYIDAFLEFMKALREIKHPFDIEIVLTANDIPVLVDSNGEPPGSKRFIETIEDSDSVCAIILMPDNRHSDISARIIPVSTLPQDITLTPLWLVKALPFKPRAPVMFYRLGIFPVDERLELFALNGITSAGIIFNPQLKTGQADLFDGMIRFIELVSANDADIKFSETEGNYVYVSNPLGENQFFLREQTAVFIILVCAFFSLIILCAFPSMFNCAGFFLILMSSLESTLLPFAVILHILLTLGHSRKKKYSKIIFASLVFLIIGFCSIGWAVISSHLSETQKSAQKITVDVSVDASLSATRLNFLEHESIILTAESELPIIRCDISVVTPGENPLYSSIFPLSIDTETFTASFELEEYPPNPLVVQYITAKEKAAVITAVFFLDGGNSTIITKQVQVKLPAGN